MHEHSESPQNAKAEESRSRRILVVEDDVGLNNLVQKALRKAGYDTDGVLNGAQAIERIRANPDMVLLLDIKLPDMTGIEVIGSLIELDCPAPFIVMTGQGDERTAVEMMKLGAHDYLVKGLDLIERLPGTFRSLFRERDTKQRLLAAEKALRESDARFRRAIIDAPSPIMIHADDGEVLQINKAWTEITGYHHAEIATIDDWTSKAYGTEMSATIQENINTQYALQARKKWGDYTITTKDGSQVIWEFSSAPLGKLADGRNVVISMAMDVTERRKATEMLRRNHELLQFHTARTPLAYIVYDLDFCVTDWNESAERIFGYSKEEAMGKSGLELIVPRKVWPLASEAMATLRRGEVASYSEAGNNTTKDGRILFCEWFNTPLRDADGSVLSVACMAQDVTERKRMEEELLKIEKLESIGVLAGGIAHDLNNFLTGIVGNIGLARTCDDLVEKDKRLEHAEVDAMRVKDLTQQLLTFAKGGAPVTKLCDLAELLTETVNFTLSGSNVSCDFVLQDDSYLLGIDEGQIRQVINNLVINAQQAMPGGGTLTVSAESIELVEGDRIPLDGGSYVKISVEDKGVGIPEEIRNRIFDPFFTTKPTGSGLGLATAYSIINKHDGLIIVDSEVGVGTRFDIYLPASNQQVLDRQESEEAGSLTGEHRILLMDDQENIREVVVLSLNRLGCEVVASMDGTKAIEEYKHAMESGNPFSAVILDLTIPGGMGGCETVKKLKELDPGVKAIVASGYSDDLIMTHYRDYGFKGVISKPYSIKGLSAVLDEVLNES